MVGFPGQLGIAVILFSVIINPVAALGGSDIDRCCGQSIRIRGEDRVPWSVGEAYSSTQERLPRYNGAWTFIGN